MVTHRARIRGQKRSDEGFELAYTHSRDMTAHAGRSGIPTHVCQWTCVHGKNAVTRVSRKVVYVYFYLNWSLKLSGLSDNWN